MHLALARAHLAGGDAARSLEVLEDFRREFGENPEWAYRRGLALRKLGKRGEARESFAHTLALARSVPGYQRAASRRWVLGSFFARLS